jgi:ABC-type phosphate/phosphonate transport system substrate-binding protein
MIAHLGMYDRPETAGANDRFWSLVRAHLSEGPQELTRGADFWEVWRSPDLLLSQTCGMPYRTRLHDSVTLVGTPDYGLEGCPPGHYCSVFIARKDNETGTTLRDFDGARFAYNEALSQSGWAAPTTHMQGLGIAPGALVQSGGHALSAQAVADGRADFAAVDALTWELIRKYDGFAGDLIELERTAPTPTLPFITATTRDPAPILAALTAAVQDLSPEDRETLHLKAVVSIPAADYLAVPTPPAPAG